MNPPVRLRIFIATPLAILCAACAAPLYQGHYPWIEGWREARVIEASVTGPADVPVDCRKQLPPEVVASRQFSLVRYVHGRGFRSRVALVPEGASIRSDDRVYVDALDCAREIVPVQAR